MRKWMIGIVLIALLILVSLTAQAETYVLDDLMATVEIPDTYVVITTDTIGTYAEWLEEREISSEELANDMIERGVLLLAYSTEDEDRVFELVATQDDTTELVFDVNEQSESYRRSYRTSFYPNNDYTDEGYTYSASTWKHADNGRFLILEYIYKEYGEIDHRGYMRRTIRNGYEIILDMQVYDRRLTTADNTALNKIWNTFKFVEILDLPAAAQAQINITSEPPEETHETEHAIEGTAAEGVTFTAVLMGLTYSDTVVTEVTVGSSGEFSIPIEIPQTGVFLVTVTAKYNDETVAELVYKITYDRTLLVVNVDTEIPSVITSDSFTIEGTADVKADLQVFVNDELYETTKVQSDGDFSVEIDTSEEGPYEVLLAFSKEDLADRRITIEFTRNFTQEDMEEQVIDDSISPKYDTLVDNNDRYDNYTINYRCYLVEVTESGDEWIYKMAVTKSGDTYSDYILVIASEEPAYEIGTRLMMYGTSVGMSVASEEVGDDGEIITGDSYPCFELLMLTTLN